MDGSYRRVATTVLHAYTTRILEGAGMTGEGAGVTASVLIMSDARGIESHGLARLPQYVKLIDSGVVAPSAVPIVERESATTALVNAQNGMGQVAGDYAMRLAIAKARRADIGVVAVRYSNHYGIAGYYAMLALEHELIGLSLTNSSPLVAPTRGRQAMVGTNPIALAVPTGDDRPFVLDMATSTVPIGRIEVYKRISKALQPGWAIDESGHQTLEAVRAHALLPLGGVEETGGYKGYGLGVLVEMLTGVLSGALYGPLIGGLWDTTSESNLGHCFMAINPAAFGPLEEFQARARDLRRLLEESERMVGAEEILSAGEKERRAEHDARLHGVRLHRTIFEPLVGLGRRFGAGDLPVLGVE